MPSGEALVTRGAILLTGLMAVSGALRAAAADVPEIVIVRSVEELRQAELHRLDNGWEVRLGLADGGAEAGPWKLLYCLTRWVGEGEPRIHIEGAVQGKMLGPVFYTLRVPGRERRALAKMAMAAMAGPEGLYAAVVPVAWRGEFDLEVFAAKGELVARRRLAVKAAEPCYWAQFARGRERLVLKGAAPWVVRREVAAAIPQFSEALTLWPADAKREALRLAEGGEPLPGQVPSRRPAHRLTLALEDDAFVIRSKVKMVVWGDRRLLARWWVNDKAVLPPRPDGMEALQVGREVTRGKLLRVAFALPGFLGTPRAGDRIGLQVLYSPARVRPLPRARAEQELRHALADADVRIARVPMLSNRLDFAVTEGLLAWHERRFRERETDF